VESEEGSAKGIVLSPPQYLVRIPVVGAGQSVMQQHSNMTPSHLLIIGAPRSGTTLLATMISRHTEIAILNEDKGWAMKKVLGKRIVGNKRCVPNQIEIRKPSRLRFRFLKTIGLANEYQSSEFSIEDYLKLPNIKLIGIIRCGDDVISSIMSRGRKRFPQAAYRWCRAVEIIHEIVARSPNAMLVVSFEGLVLHPRRNMERVADFLNVDYQDRFLEGPQYNPWYPEANMNRAKVNSSRRGNVDFALSERFPAQYRQYQKLLEVSEGPAPQRFEELEAANFQRVGL
jgi:Sulfotransferase family